MKQQGIFPRLLLVAGSILAVITILSLLLWQTNLLASHQQAADYVNLIKTLIPEPQGAALEERTNNDMPVLSLDGTDYIGILEMPRYNSALPVCGDWSRYARFPGCYLGNVYEGSLQIGGTSRKGQYDFFREISVGDAVYFTDMTGNYYQYTVRNIRYAQHADQQIIKNEDAALTLFIKNIYAFEYILVFCDIAN